MKVGLILPLFSGDPAKVLDVARRAEDLGFDGAFAFDHFFPPGAARDRPALEAFTTLAAVGQACPSLSIGTLVTRAALRPIGMLAKLASSLDAATGGRMILGIGTGDPLDAPEHDAYGIPAYDKQDRRVHLGETLEALRALFEGRDYAGGRFVPRLEGPLLPPPARSGGPPMWVGAQADPVVRMAGRLADGWNGWGMDPEKFAAKVATLREEADAVGRSVDPTWAGLALVGRDANEAEGLVADRQERGMIERVWSGHCGLQTQSSR